MSTAFASTIRAVSTVLFVSGATPERFEKALASDADLVCIDLEDSVPNEAKAQAREAALQAIHKRGFWYADFIEKNIFCDKSGRFFLIDLDSTQPESSVPDTDMWGSKEYWGLVFKYCTDVLHSTAIKPSHFNGISFNYLHAIFLILRLKIFSFDVAIKVH